MATRPMFEEFDVRPASDPPSAPPAADQRTDLTALALAARTRDPEATRAFLAAALPKVRSVCRSVLGTDHAELDDTIQECLVELLQALPQYRARGPAVNYAKQIALHCALGVRRRGVNRERRLRRLAQEHSTGTLDVHVQSMPSLRLIRGVLDELPAVQAEAILMRSVLGFSLEEIALATQVSVNTAKSRLRVAKENLRRQLDRNDAPRRAGPAAADGSTEPPRKVGFCVEPRAHDPAPDEAAYEQSDLLGRDASGAAFAARASAVDAVYREGC